MEVATRAERVLDLMDLVTQSFAAGYEAGGREPGPRSRHRHWSDVFRLLHKDHNWRLLVGITLNVAHTREKPSYLRRVKTTSVYRRTMGSRKPLIPVKKKKVHKKR